MRSQLDHPPRVGELRREVKLDGPLPEARRQGRRDGGGGVDHEQVAGVQEARQLGEACVHQRAVAAPGDEHRDVLAADAPDFGRRRRRDRVGQHGDTHPPLTSTSRAR